jgi:protein TonB
VTLHTRILIAGVALLIASPAIAGKSWQDQTWIERVKESSLLLKSGDYNKALRISERVLKEMTEQLGPGNAATEAFGIALTHKALALAGLGRFDEALWYWHTVVALYPPFERSDLSMFGKPGEFLKANVLPPADQSPVPHADDATTPPVVIDRVAPEYPHGAYVYSISGFLIVELIITKEGRVHSPRVLKPLAAVTLSYATLEAVRKWRFKPAMRDGQPIEVRFALTVNYKIPER